MYCKDCKFRKILAESGVGHHYCSSEKLVEGGRYKSEGNRLIYSYEEGGRFYVEDYFGCVHFEEEKDYRILYACGYRVSDGSYGMWAGPSLSLLEMEACIPEEEDYPAFIIRLSDDKVIRKWVNGKWIE